MSEVFSLKSEREKIYTMMLNGQFNDCLNIDNISKLWDNPESKSHMEKGGSFQEAMSLYNKDCSVRRQQEVWPNVGKALRGLKKLKKGDYRRLAVPEGVKDFQTLELLKAEIEKIMIEVRGFTINEAKDAA